MELYAVTGITTDLRMRFTVQFQMAMVPVTVPDNPSVVRRITVRAVARHVQFNLTDKGDVTLQT
ncbi:hypothetical protein KP79_PYT24845 [Mizuhopecten yessoensis]|uniref:Uncharacterized protein n=1 Tax=Mizuhopecten yessoensis TaxID=6573 RepID=A0A210PDB8_MIZYE|nr:hypothetical protein KP79_PYT24845 [Mizuhopecten yessoensis]